MKARSSPATLLTGERAILLSIRPEHAEKIFQGAKHYELRKVLPSVGFNRVFLYETGGRGIVGCFDVGAVLKKDIDELWNVVGNAATTRERFFEYFKNIRAGYAIEIKNPLRFSEPISAKSLNGDGARLNPPQSFILLEPGDALYSALEVERLRALRHNPPRVSLRRISDESRAEYQRLVMRYISPNYEDIDESFAAGALKVHDLGYDPAGFFTTKKEVLEIIDRRSKVVGFTTLTYKSPGCVKTGPTILRKPFRSKGYGVAARTAIEEYVKPGKARKLYCTCPEGSERVIRYLLASGMRIEAHLERHYASTHNELVFGKLLLADEASDEGAAGHVHGLKGHIADPVSFARNVLVADFAKLFEATWSPVSQEFASAIVDQVLDEKTQDQSQKPKRLVCLKRERHCIGAIALLPKRGGAVKGLLLRGTRHVQSLHALIDSASGLASALKGRKLYFLHPVFDSLALTIFRSTGFQTEGLLRAPYRPGQDAVVLSKFL
jgi:predicted transcriptional regulator/RimJ/RimL family protein N-acetyltransferase